MKRAQSKKKKKDSEETALGLHSCLRQKKIFFSFLWPQGGTFSKRKTHGNRAEKEGDTTKKKKKGVVSLTGIPSPSSPFSLPHPFQTFCLFSSPLSLCLYLCPLNLSDKQRKKVQPNQPTTSTHFRYQVGNCIVASTTLQKDFNNTKQETYTPLFFTYLSHFWGYPVWTRMKGGTSVGSLYPTRQTGR